MPKVYPVFVPSTGHVFGGSEVDLYYLSTELAKDPAFDVSFVVAAYGQPPEEIREGVRLLRSMKLSGNMLASTLQLWHAMKKAASDIYITKTASAGVPLIAYFCQMHRKSFVYRVAHKRECDGTYTRQNPWLGRAFKWGLHQAAHVVCQNVEDIDSLKTTMCVNAVAIPNGHRLTCTEGLEKESILWVGRTVDFKHPERFLTLARQFPDEKFVMICQRATGDTRYDAFVREVRFVPNIEFHERVGFRDIDACFQRAKVFVNTSDSEGFPNTFIQAAKSAAAILSLTVNPDQFLTQHSCGLDCRGSEQKLADGLRFLLENDRYLELGQNGRRYVRRHHDIAKIIEQYKTIFRRLVAERRS